MTTPTLPDLQAAARMALDALETCDAQHPSDGGRQWYDDKAVDAAITALRAALSAAPAAPFDVEAMLTACVPGGASCDPQQVADAIRAYCAAPSVTGGSPEHLLQDQDRGLSRWLADKPDARLHAREAAAAIAKTATTRGGWFLDCGQSNIGVLWQQVEAGTDGAVWLSADAGAQQSDPAMRTAVRLVLDATPDQLPAALDALRDHAAAPVAQQAADPQPVELLQAGFNNVELRAHWDKKLPGVEPTDRELSAFAVGTEVGFARARDLERQDWSRVWHALARAGLHPGRTDDRAEAVIDRLVAERDALKAAHAQQQAATVQPLSDAQVLDVISNAGGNSLRCSVGSAFLLVRETERAHGITATQQAPTDTDTAKD